MNNLAYVVEFEEELDAKKATNGKVEPPTATYPYEEAISLAGVGRFHYKLLFICGVCFTAVMVEVMSVGIFLPSMKCDIASTITEDGILGSSGFLGIVLSSHAMGFLADTWGRLRVLRMVFMIGLVFAFISAFSVNIWMLIVFRFLTGFFISGGQACVFSLCGEFHGNKSRARHVTLLSVFLPMALVFLPVMAILILPLRIDTFIGEIKFSSWRLLLLVNSLLTITALLGFYLLPESPKFLLAQGDHDNALAIMRQIFASNTGLPADEYPVKHVYLECIGANLTNIRGFKDALKLIWDQTVPLFYRERCLHTLNICIMMFIIYGVCQGIFMWFPTILNEMVAKQDLGLRVCHLLTQMDTHVNHTSNICSGEMDTFPLIVIVVMGVVFVCFYLLFGLIIDFVGKKSLLISWLCLCSACAIITHWVSNFYVIVFMLTLVMAVGNCSGIVSTISMEFFPTNINAMGMCFIMMIGRAGAVVGNNILGQFLFNNCDDVFWGLFGIFLLLCVMGWLLPVKNYSKQKNPAPKEVG